MKIRAKILLFILTTSIVIFLLTVVLITFYSRSITSEHTRRLTESYAEKASWIVKSQLEQDLSVVRTVAHSFHGFEKLSQKDRKSFYTNILKNVLVENDDYLAVWVSFEMWAIDSSWQKTHGRIRYVLDRNDNMINMSEDSLEFEQDNTAGLYYKIKVAKNEYITDPYWFSYTDSQRDQILETSIAVPLILNQRFGGLVGIDVPLDNFSTILKQISPLKESFVFLLSNNGNYVSHPSNELINTSAAELIKDDTQKALFLQNIKTGTSTSLDITDNNGIKYFYYFYPINIGDTNSPWSIGIVIPEHIIMEEPNRIFNISIIGGVSGLLVLTIIILIVAQTITTPIKQTTKILKELAKGKIDKSFKLKAKSKDEMGEMARSVNTLIDELNHTANLARQIGMGNLDTELVLLSDEDVLGKSLVEMQKSLKKAEEEVAHRRKEEEKSNWANTGVAKFGDLLRVNMEQNEELYFLIIKELSKYLNVNQGGLFLVNDDDPDKLFIELKAAYAYDRQHLDTKRIEYGTGLIGRAIREHETIYINDLPHNYLEVGSGLGASHPRHLLIVPLTINNVTLGAIELASFGDIEPHQIQFVEKVSDSIAATLANIKTNIRTAALLEESKQKSKELAEKEHVLRKNLEELEAAQQEMRRMKDAEAERHKEISMMREETKKMFQNIINSSPYYIYLKDEEGIYRFVNDAYAASFNKKTREMVGKSDFDFIDGAEAANLRQQDIAIMQQGKKTFFYTTVWKGEKKVFQITKMPFYIDFIEKNGVLGIQIDVTEAVQTSPQLQVRLSNLI